MRATADDDGKVLGTVLNYACHPTTLAWQNDLIGPDYPGAAREVVENVLGAPCLFLQGASADLGPRHGYVGDTAVADSNGRQLGYAALSALEALPPPGALHAYAGPVISGATVGTWEWRALQPCQQESNSKFHHRHMDIPLSVHPGLPTRDAEEASILHWEAALKAAEENSQDAEASDARAMAERSRRMLARLKGLPKDPKEPFLLDAHVLKLGGAVWVIVQGRGGISWTIGLVWGHFSSHLVFRFVTLITKRTLSMARTISGVAWLLLCTGVAFGENDLRNVSQITSSLRKN